MSKKQISKSLEVKIATVVAVSVVLRSPNVEDVGKHLKEITGGQDDYFDHELAVLDLGNLAQDALTIDWPELLQLLRNANLNPVAVRHAPDSLLSTLKQLGLSIDDVGTRSPAAPAATTAPVAQPAQARPVSAATPPAAAPATTSAHTAVREGSMVIDTPVRGGQRIYARGTDLVVTAIVNAGAELIADGSIHVYAPLRGRALAGASGDAGARIFALAMEAELVSIAGMYRTFEDGPPKELSGRPVEVRLSEDRLVIRNISGERKS